MRGVPGILARQGRLSDDADEDEPTGSGRVEWSDLSSESEVDAGDLEALEQTHERDTEERAQRNTRAARARARRDW